MLAPISFNSQRFSGTPVLQHLTLSAANNAQALKFGRFANGKDTVGLYIDPEPVASGGLGSISRELPPVFQTELGVPLWKIQPVLEPLMGEAKKAKRLASFTMTDPTGKPQKFDVLELPEAEGVRRIGIANETLLGSRKTLYGDSYKAGIGGFEAATVFNRAVAELLNNHQKALGKPVKFMIANDWMTSSVMSQLTPETAKAMRKVYIFHNHYDQVRKPKALEKMGLKLSPELAQQKYISAVGLGVQSADYVMINSNYLHSLTQGSLAKGEHFLNTLKQLPDRIKLMDLHHGLLDRDDATVSAHLKGDGFVNLPKGAGVEEMAKFKRANKTALQHQLGLKADPDATIFTWLGRFDPTQKGFKMVADNVETTLKQNPKSQIIITGMEVADPEVIESLKHMQEMAKGAYKGRLFIKTAMLQPVEKERQFVYRTFSGSDFVMMPSIYEPFGLVQMEAMKMGTIPIVTNVDGLRSTTSDPARNGGQYEKAWDYGKTAIKMKDFDTGKYKRAYHKVSSPPDLTPFEEKQLTLSKKRPQGIAAGGFFTEFDNNIKELIEDKIPNEADHAALKEASGLFREAMDRAINLAKDPSELNDVRLKAYTYVNEQHTWKAITERFYKPLLRSMFPMLRDEKASA